MLTAPEATDYPFLSSKVDITAPTCGEVAGIVLAAFAHRKQIRAQIEAIRLRAKMILTGLIQPLQPMMSWQRLSGLCVPAPFSEIGWRPIPSAFRPSYRQLLTMALMTAFGPPEGKPF